MAGQPCSEQCNLLKIVTVLTLTVERDLQLVHSLHQLRRYTVWVVLTT